MKRAIGAICLAAACSVVAVMAQSSMDKDAMKDHDKMMKGTVMVTGCVGDKDSMGHYMLNNAMMPSMPSMPDMTTNSAAPMMSYMLSGGDLKPHVGHKVEVTGTMEKAKAAKKMDAKMADGKMMSDTLKVKSVKMLAASCM